MSYRATLLRGLLSGVLSLWLGGWSGEFLQAEERPRLVVVISVDQLCQEYLQRFADNFSDTGILARIAREGSQYTQCHHRHAYTYTGPGHAVQLTGAYPNTSGIVGNNWFDRETNQSRYCVADDGERLVGVPSGQAMSPRTLLVDTVGDVLKGATGRKAKVFGVGIKDRAAILMTGHLADAAFWMEEGAWVTSTYYRSDLPGYLRVLNEPAVLQKYAGREWTLALPRERYHNGHLPDENSWENPPKGMTGAFPHRVGSWTEKPTAEFIGQIELSPFGNELTLAVAREVITGEGLGRDETPDLLCINLSSNDYVGHAFGPHSLEVEDMTYQTDRQLGEFSRYLDEQIGKGKWTLAITADHGVAPIVEYAKELRLPARRSPLGGAAKVKAQLEARLRSQLQVATDAPPLVQLVEEYQVYLVREHAALQGERLAVAQRVVRDWLLAQPGVVKAVTPAELNQPAEDRLYGALYRAFHPRRSGDVLFVLQPYTVPGTRGTTHGTPWRYDTHVPLLLVGAGIQQGVHHREVSPACLASTVAELVGVDYPAGNVERPLEEAVGWRR